MPGGLHSSQEGLRKFETEKMLYIDPVECIDCGACVPVCPVSAIFALDDLPEKWKDYAERNAKYFGRARRQLSTIRISHQLNLAHISIRAQAAPFCWALLNLYGFCERWVES